MKYTPETKAILITRYFTQHESIASIVADTGIPRSTLYHWINEYQKNHSSSSDSEKRITPRKIEQLEAKIERLEGLIQILKAVPCTVHAPLSERLNAIEQLYGQYNIHMLCEAMNISRSTFYNHILRNKRNNTWYAKRREELRIKIQEVFDDNRQIFGAGKVAGVLQQQGIRVSERMVRELMQDMGLSSIRKDAKALYEKDSLRYKNHLNQQFNPEHPNEIWVSDVTQFRFNNKFFYICVIIDLYARMVVGYKVSLRNSTHLIKLTFRQAYESRKPELPLIFHTDRGVNYRSKAFCDYLKSLGVTQSFSRTHVPYDNSVMESFFASMKREELYRMKYRSERELLSGIDSYIVFYNTKRPIKQFKYKTPVQREIDYANARTEK